MVVCQKWRLAPLMLKVRSRVRTTTKSAQLDPSSYAAKPCDAWTQPVATSVSAGSPRDQPLVCRLEGRHSPGEYGRWGFPMRTTDVRMLIHLARPSEVRMPLCAKSLLHGGQRVRPM